MGGIAWLPLALLSYAMQAVGSVVDRTIVHAEVTKPIVISFWVAFFSVATTGILLIGWLPVPGADQFRFEAPDVRIFSYVVVAGAMTQTGLLFMYRSLERGEVTRVTSIVGAVTPLVALIASYFALDERLGGYSLLAVALLIAGTITLTMQPGKKAAGSKVWVVDAAIAAIILALQSVLMKIVFDEYHFISAFALTGVGALVYVGGLALISSDVRAVLHAVLSPPQKLKPKQKPGRQPKSQVVWIIGNTALGGVAAIILNLALKLGTPTYVNALRGFQYAVVFLIAIALAHRFPRLLDEELTRRVVIVKLSGILFVVNGVVLLAIQ